MQVTENRKRAQHLLTGKKKRYKILYGGRGSAKSWLIARALIELAVRYKMRVLCTREFQNSIKDSVIQLLSDTIERCGYEELFDVQATTITCKRTNSDFLFYGLRSNISKVKSLEGVDICWVEEAENVSANSWTVLIPTIRKANSQIWGSFNPQNILDDTYQRFIIKPGSNVESVMLNWRDNPYFPDVLMEEMLEMREKDNELYLHVWEGHPVADTQQAIIKPSWIEAAVDAKTKLDLVATGIRQIGLDVADEGVDSNALFERHGFEATYLDQWKEGDTGMTAVRAFNHCINNGILLANYDSIGVGAGVKAKTNELNENLADKVAFNGFNAGGGVIYPEQEYMPGRKNINFFENVKAQAWWQVRDRFQTTFNAIVKGKEYTEDQIISLPPDLPLLDFLKAELSRPRVSYSRNGKVKVESKIDLAKRGIPSTNLADAMIMAYFQGEEQAMAGALEW